MGADLETRMRLSETDKNAIVLALLLSACGALLMALWTLYKVWFWFSWITGVKYVHFF